MIGAYGDYHGLFSNRKPGEVVFAVLNPIGWLAQGNPTTSKIERIMHPISPSQIYRKKTGGQFKDKAANLQAEAHEQIRKGTAPQAPVYTPPPAARNTTGLLVGSAILAGAVIVLATYFSTR